MRNFLRILIVTILICSLSSCGFVTNKNLHGEALQQLSDNELYEAVYFQNLDIVVSDTSEKNALEGMSEVRRTFYILSMYEYEISNGGLCQFFVNTTRGLAPYVSDCLGEIGANEHKELFDEFILNNNIDVYDLDSFIIDDVDEFAQQNARYDFDSFDEAFYDLPFLRDYLVRYVRNNINEF